jgi:F-type H+-transporting ATPase subunit b
MQPLRMTLFYVVLSLIIPIGIACASGGDAEHAGPWTAELLFWRVVNTVVLIGFLVYVMKKPIVTFFSERREQIAKDIDDAKEKREKAEVLIKEYEAKIAGMEKELDRMRAEFAATAEVESGKLVANAERMAASMVEAAKVAAEQEVRKAKIVLKNEAVTLAVEMAEALIREKINDADRKRIVDDYLVKVGGMK